jgi:hypothetical protein
MLFFSLFKDLRKDFNSVGDILLQDQTGAILQGIFIGAD